MADTPSDKIQQEAWFSIGEAAEYLGVSEPTIYRWMRDGKLSFYKVGDSTRFRRESLEMVVEKHTGAYEADYYGSHCVACGHSRLVRGHVQSTGNAHLKSAHTRFLTPHQSMVRVEARVCPVCGFVQMFADTKQLGRLLTEADKKEEQHED